jgi:MFS family permease
MVTTTVARARLTTNQIRGFWAAWGGWALDGMDSFIYALVLAPALRELLPRSGIPNRPENVAFYGSVMFALFLIGWGLSMIWGPLADRFGRVRTLMLTILCYSLFTFLSGLVVNIWQLAICRLVAGIGIGGEWSMGGTFVAEEWPEDRRKMGAGYMHTGYYFGFFLAAIANAYIGATYGWRWMFILGFGYVFYLQANALTAFFVVLFFLGVGGANFAMYTLWLPEQYSTECRASAFAFATSVGRFAGAGITFLVGAGVTYFHTIGTPVALTSIAFLIGLALLPLGEETKGKPLPA